jgi:FkbM family methyltransferase
LYLTFPIFTPLIEEVKNSIKYILQKSLGFQTYLYVFSLFKIKTLKTDKKEGDFFHFLSLLKDKSGAVLDVGANIGIMTYHLAKSLPNCKIHAIEPIQQNLSVLYKIVDRFHLSNVQVHALAVGDEVKKVQMILPTNQKTKMQGLSHVKHESITEWNEGFEYEVQQEMLDNIIREERIQGIKIDVENYEFFALKGAKNLLEKHHPVIYAELWDNVNRKQCFELLGELAYQPFVVVNHELTTYNSNLHKHQNFIFLPSE